MHEKYYRYIRHIVLSDIGLKGQDLLFKSRVLCVGAGGLGSPVLTYLASSGIGYIGLVDFDVVDLSNLNRQFIYNIFDVSNDKSFSAFNFLKKLNTDIFIFPYKAKLSKNNFFDIMAGYDIILDCTDTLESKFLISDFAMKLNLPVVHGSVFGFSGYVSMFSRFSGCYRCLYQSFSYVNCVGHGIIGPVAGIIGSIQALETIKFLLNKGNVFNNLFSRVLVLDFKKLNFLTLTFKKSFECIGCN